MDGNRFDRFTRRIGGRTTRRTAVGGALSAFALGALHQVTAAQQATPDPAATPDTGEEPVFMFVQTALLGRAEVNPAAGTPTVEGTPTPGGGASFLLTLEGHSGQTIFFSDRPDRVVGAAPTQAFLDTLGFSPANPPNAALVGEFAGGDGVVVLELIEPVYDEATSTLTYGVEVLEGYGGEGLAPVTQEQIEARLPAEFEHASLFIDDCPDLTECIFVCGCPFCTTCSAGPIPGGPYGQCWQGLFQGGCQPCHYSWDELEGFCNSAYGVCNGECHVG